MPFQRVIVLAKRFLNWPLSRKIQYVGSIYWRLKSKVIYQYMFEKIGSKCIIKNPLFITPEFINLGDNVIIWDDARIEAIDHYGEQVFNPKIIIEDGVTIQQRCHITAADKLVIGANSLISFDVMIQDSEHQYTEPNLPVAIQPLIIRQTRIGENCFIGSGAKIQAGSRLGKHCIVGSNSVVKGIFPDYCVIAGVPARIIKRFDIDACIWRKTDFKGNFVPL